MVTENLKMLTIRRVPTVVSINQVSEQNCGRNCLGSCCLPGANIPVYKFPRRKSLWKRIEDGDQSAVAGDQNSRNVSATQTLFDALILSKWEEREERGLFRYDVTTCETKILEGDFGFVAQLNEGRHSKKRPTEFRIDQVLQPFDGKKFNFTKLGQEEILFRFEENDKEKPEYNERATMDGSSPNVIAINVSPIEYGHVLLVPRVMDCIPQRIDPDTLLLALQMAVEARNPYFRLGYNSLGAFATINHMHFQAYYMLATFAIERAETMDVAHSRFEGGVKISELNKYPVRGLVYEMGLNLDALAEVVAKACMVLQEKNVPYNVLIADCGARVFLIPQCFAEKQAKGEVDRAILDTQVNPAVWEISGHLVLKREEDYEMATEEYAWKLLAEVSLSENRFKEVKDMCLNAAEEIFSRSKMEGFDEILTRKDGVAKVGYWNRTDRKLESRKKLLRWDV